MIATKEHSGTLTKRVVLFTYIEQCQKNDMTVIDEFAMVMYGNKRISKRPKERVVFQTVFYADKMFHCLGMTQSVAVVKFCEFFILSI